MSRDNLIASEKFDKLVTIKDLIFTISFEDRSFLSVKRLIKKFKVNRCTLLVFNNYFEETSDLEYKDKITSEKYVQEYKETVNYLIDKKIKFSELRGSIFSNDIIEMLKGKKSEFEYPLLLDISCMPRNYILSILSILDLDKTILAYSMVEKYSDIEEDFVIGNRSVNALNGFAGEIRHQDSILILILGFQGNRAMSILRKYNPYLTLAIIPKSDDKILDANIKIVYKNNVGLLNNQFVRCKEISAFNPINFNKELDILIKSFIREENLDISKFNIILSHLGPKLDLISIYKYLINNKNYQIAVSMPTRYRNYSEGIGDTYIIEYKDIL
jgi:hypothetical protein